MPWAPLPFCDGFLSSADLELGHDLPLLSSAVSLVLTFPHSLC